MIIITVWFCTGVVTSGGADQTNEEADRAFRQGKWEEASQRYRMVVESDPSADAYNKLGEALFYLNRLDEAEDAFRNALEREENLFAEVFLHVINAKQGYYDVAMNGLRLLEVKYGDDFMIYRGYGRVFSYRGDYGKAIKYYTMAIKRDPGDVMSHFEIAVLYEEQELFNTAITAYRKVLRLNPVFAQALNNLGYCYKELHFYTYAIDMYRKAIAIMPDNAGFHYNIGNAYTHKGMIDEAFRSYQKALELDPTFAKAHYNMGMTYLRKGAVQEAVREFELYLKYGDKAVFRFIKDPDEMKNEIEELRRSLSESGS